MVTLLLHSCSDIANYLMSLSTQCRLGQQYQLWQIHRTVSAKRPSHTYTTISCNGVRRWSPVEEGKEKAQRLEQKAQQLEQAVMPDTQNLCVYPNLRNRSSLRSS